MSWLVACSTAKKKKKRLVISRTLHRHMDDDGIYRSRCKLVCIPCDTLIRKDNPKLTTSELLLPRSKGFDIRFGTCSMCIGSVIYFLGGLYAPVEYRKDVSPEDDSDYLLNKVFRYDLDKLPRKVGNPSPCADMIARMFHPLIVHDGGECVYALTYGKAEDGFRRPIFQMFNCKHNEWNLVGCQDQVVDIIERCDPNNNVCNNIHNLPHVVIGQKIHLSLGYSSFTFDTATNTWKTCKLFKTFWSKLIKGKSDLSPSNFYGKYVYYAALDQDMRKKKKKRKMNSLVGGSPFGFYGKGLVWDNNVLLGVHYGKCCPLVAFLLDGRGRVVKSQPITLNNLELDGGILHNWARIVDVGGGGCFSLVHARVDFVTFDDGYGGDSCRRAIDIELVTFRLKKVTLDNADEDFLECEVIRKNIIEKGLGELEFGYDAFCV